MKRQQRVWSLLTTLVQSSPSTGVSKIGLNVETREKEFLSTGGFFLDIKKHMSIQLDTHRTMIMKHPVIEDLIPWMVRPHCR